MKNIYLLLSLILSSHSFSECIWSKSELIPNEYKIEFQECQAEKKLKINKIIVVPNIKFEIIHKYWPEGNSIWSKTSSDNKPLNRQSL